MRRTVRNMVAMIALGALCASVLRVHPCIDEATCGDACAPAATADACAAPEGGHQHDAPPPHACDCPCHVPAVAVSTPAGPARDAPITARAERHLDPLRGGFPHPPFRPPNA